MQVTADEDIIYLLIRVGKGEKKVEKTILFVVLQQYADWEAAYISSAVAMLGEGQYEIKLGFYTAPMPEM